MIFVGGCDSFENGFPGLGYNGAAEEKLFDYRQVELDNGLEVVTLEDFSTPMARSRGIIKRV